MLAQYGSEGWDENGDPSPPEIGAHMGRRPPCARHLQRVRRVPRHHSRAISRHVPARCAYGPRIPAHSVGGMDYRGNFGIVVHSPDGAIVPDVPINAALGLTLPTAPAIPAGYSSRTRRHSISVSPGAILARQDDIDDGIRRYIEHDGVVICFDLRAVCAVRPYRPVRGRRRNASLRLQGSLRSTSPLPATWLADLC